MGSFGTKLFGTKPKAALWVLAVASIALPAQGQIVVRRMRATNLRQDAGYLGVGVRELTDDRVKALRLKDDHGIEVTGVAPNSPAAKAGIKDEDVILEVSGKPIEDMEQFLRSIAESAPGTKVDLTLWRNGATQKIAATLDSRPPNQLFAIPNMPPMPPMPPMPAMPDFPALPGSPALIGFEGEALSPQLAEFFGVKDGVLVRTVYPNTPAEKAGLKAGDVVTKVNGTPVTSSREISGLARAGRRKPLALTVVRNKKEVTLSVEIAEAPSTHGEAL